MSIKEVLNNNLQTETSDIADGVGLYVGTNPPRELNIAMAISGGRTTNIAEALDIHYGNTEPSFTISKAIAAGAGTDDPTESIEDIMSEALSEGDYCTVTFDAGVYSNKEASFELWPKEPSGEEEEPLDIKKIITFRIPKDGAFPVDPYGMENYPDLSVGNNEWVPTPPPGYKFSCSLNGYTLQDSSTLVNFPYTITEDVTLYASWFGTK